MKVYKVIFAKDEVILCSESKSSLPNGRNVYVEQNNGHPIYALVKASSPEEAISRASLIQADNPSQPHIEDPDSSSPDYK